MEDYQTACSLIKQGDYLAVVDQKQAYHAVSIHKDYQIILKFRWSGELFKSTCLPFGLNIAPVYFTKLMKPVLASLNVKGFRPVAFLDYTILIGKKFSDCSSNMNSTIELFSRLGLSVHDKESELVPKTSVKFLGFVCNTITYSISLPKEKQENVKTMY